MADQMEAQPAPEQTVPDSSPTSEAASSAAPELESQPATASTSDAPAELGGSAATEGSGQQIVADEEGERDGDGPTVAGAEASSGEAGPKRKRKRKRKRKGGEGAPENGTGSDSATKVSHAPFAALFVGGANKRHAFAAGEVVAGRVTRVEDGAIVVDLFGKALAYADEHEPRDVPPAPEPAPLEPEAPTLVQPAEVSEAENESLPAPGLVGQPIEPASSATPELIAGAANADDHDVHAADAGMSNEGVAGETGSAEHVDAADSEPGSDEGDSPAEDAKGPLKAAPVVSEEFPRLEPFALGGIFKGRVGSVSESGHIVLVNRNLVRSEVKASIARCREERRRVEGLVYGYNRGGFDVLVQGVRAFCPASAMALGEISDPDEFLGRKYEFLLPPSKGGKDIVVSRRSILERESRKRAKELLRTLQAGQELEGRVTSVREFGVFVDIGGVEGLVHQSELSHAFGVRPSDVAKAGDVVKVKVLRVGGDSTRAKGDKKDRTTRVSLSIKALQADPWDEHKDAVAEGAIREGRITRTTEFGAFVQIADTIEGLLHISELGRDLKHASEAVSEGDEILVIVERADRKARRISLSKLSDTEIEQYRAGTLDASSARVDIRQGARIEVTVDKADHRGVQVRVPGAIGRRARGFIPASETGTDRGSDLRKVFPSGETVEVKVIGNDRDGGIKCSIKALAIDEERKAVKDYRREASKQGFGTFGDLLKAKLGKG